MEERIAAPAVPADTASATPGLADPAAKAAATPRVDGRASPAPASTDRNGAILFEVPEQEEGP